jgi:predicted O-methyltransferase YrrM
VPYDLTVPGWMSEPNLKVIEGLARRVPEGGRIVEIGSFCGRSATAWASSAPGATLHCIDTWQLDFQHLPPVWIEHMPGNLSRYRGSAERTFREVTAGLSNVVPLKGRSTDAWGLQPADVVFLDGDHSEQAVAQELHLWSSRLAPGGLICGDDFRTEDMWIGVIKAVTDFALAWRHHLVVPADTTIWMLFSDADHLRRWWP